MWSRRSLLAGVGASLSSLTGVGLLQNTPDTAESRYVSAVSLDDRRLDLDHDTRTERLVSVSFVPTRRLVAVRLEGRVVDATNLALADELDSDDDGWYTIAGQTGIGREDGGTTQFVRAPRSRQVPGFDERWIAEHRGFAPDSDASTDFRGFEDGSRLRFVVVPYYADPVVVSEHVVGDTR